MIRGMRGCGLNFGRWSLAAAAVVAGCAWRAAPPPAAPPPPPAARSRPARPPAPAPASAAEAAEITSGCGISRLRDTVLHQVNAARAAARSCGSKQMKAVGPLGWNRALAEAAEQHSVDMAVHRYFDHVGPDGTRVSQRVAAQGYNWRTVGENLAGGDTTVSGVLSGWLKSPEHCQNIMSPTYTEVGVACVRQPGSQWGNYWTMVLGTRR
jgi:uncharacterized protein YkwD